MARRRSTRRGRGEGTVSERPDGTWTGQVTTGYDENGKQKRKTVYGKTQAEALAKLAEVKQRLANGTYSDTKLTVESYLEQWLKEKERTLKPSMLEQYTSCIGRSIMPHVGKIKLDKLTPMQVQALVNEIHDTSGAARAAKCRTVLFMDAKVLANRLGHTRASFTLDRYTHLFESQRAQSAVSLLDLLPKPKSNPNAIKKNSVAVVKQ